ncbi:hypothetical protein ACIRH0_06630 [Streptomyces sp. NPDC093675]|uniref:DUF6414 family protein n=1 Tax=Streptomyces sp. NPDC093675 TaxID=3366049 RepID=UPI00381D76F3
MPDRLTELVVHKSLMTQYGLAHPLYLDVQMMVSFLAYLEGGVYVSIEETTQREKSKEGKGGGNAKMKLPSLGALLGMEASLSAEMGGRVGETAEIKVARHHTAASLFNALRSHLADSKSITIHRAEKEEDLASLSSGDFVESSGRYTGNPLAKNLAFMGKFLEYIQLITDVEERNRQRSSSARRSGNPQTRASVTQIQSPGGLAELADQFREFQDSAELNFLQKVKEEIEASPIQDVVLRTRSGLQVILTVSSDYYNQSVGEWLDSGDFIVLGKVTRVLSPGESINLSRRTVIGSMDDGEDMVTSLTTSFPLVGDSQSAVVNYPAVQVLPMAIYV